MILIVDIGNTNICITLFAEDTPQSVFFTRIPTKKDGTKEFFTDELKKIFSQQRIRFSGNGSCLYEDAYGNASEISCAALSSVVPSITAAMEEALKIVTEKQVYTISPAAPLPFPIHIDDPMTLGADIIADVMGALSIADGPILTFDLGTASVTSIVSSEPAIEGVLIAPGIRTSLRAVKKEMPHIGDISLEKPDSLLGKTDKEAVQSGAVFGTADYVDGIIDRIEEETNTKYKVFITGGLSKYILPYCRHEMHDEAELLVRGLWQFARYQKKN